MGLISAYSVKLENDTDIQSAGFVTQLKYLILNRDVRNNSVAVEVNDSECVEEFWRSRIVESQILV